MAKRAANKYITDQNWEEEDEPEEMGEFKVADASVLKQRVIKKARRRGTGASVDSSSGTGAFSGFGGLVKPSGNGSAKPFSFGSTQSKPFSFGAGAKVLPFGSNKPLTFGSNIGSLNSALSSSSGALPKPSNNGDTTVSSTSALPKLPKPAAANDQVKSNESEASSTTVNIDTDFSKENGTKHDKAGADEKLQCNTLSSSSVDKEKAPQNVTKDDDEYNKHLRALNKGVCSWIVEHVDKNPLCDLTPIFMDYKKHLSEIDQKFNIGEGEESTPENSSLESNTPNDSSRPSSQECSTSISSSPNASPKIDNSTSNIAKSVAPTITIAETSSNNIKVPAKNPLENILSSSNQKAPVFAGFGSGLVGSSDDKTKFSGFGSSKADPPKFAGFGSSKSDEKPKFTGFGGFGSTTSGFSGFQFQSSMVAGGSNGNSGSAPVSSTTEANDSEYVPPKPEATTIEEKDAFYSKKCKLFYLSDGSYTSKGVGYLHLKPVPDTDKTQLIVRADNALGTILLNISLNPALPISRQGKNNVNIVCIPNPPISNELDGKLVPLLVRVKTSEEADELKELLDKKKGTLD